MKKSIFRSTEVIRAYTWVILHTFTKEVQFPISIHLYNHRINYYTGYASTGLLPIFCQTLSLAVILAHRLGAKVMGMIWGRRLSLYYVGLSGKYLLYTSGNMTYLIIGVEKWKSRLCVHILFSNKATFSRRPCLATTFLRKIVLVKGHFLDPERSSLSKQ